MSGLTTEHEHELVVGSGVAIERARRNFRSVHSARDCAKATGIPVSQWVDGTTPALEILYRFPFREHDYEFSRFKPAIPIELGAKDGKRSSAKYVTPKGAPNRIYYSTLALESLDWLSDTAVDVCITEGEKKCESAASFGFIALGLPGVSMWHRKGEKSLHPDFAHAEWEERRVFITFDRDSLSNAAVRKQEEELARVFVRRRARVFIVRLPEDAPKLDDFLVKYGSEAFAALKTQTREVLPEPADKISVSEGKQLTDLGNAERLVLAHGEDLRYCKSQNRWFPWGGKRWSPDEDGEPLRLAAKTIRGMYTEAANLDDDEARRRLIDHARKSESKQRLAAMVDLAGSQLRVAIRASDFDKDPYLLNTPNGTLDLRTGKLRAHARADLITKITRAPYEPNAECPTWDRFILACMGDDSDLVAYVQRAVGYSLTGDVREHCMFFCYGSGANGKGTAVNTLVRLLGDYAKPGAPDLLLEKRTDSHPTEMADLCGARLVSTQEVKAGAWDEATLKSLTGGDPIKARRMREDFWSFEPTHKFWVSGNHKPHVRGGDDGIWRRLRLIPFEVSFKGREDKTLGEKLSSEAPGILAWAVRGCLEWQRIGLAEPSRVLAHTEAYRRESDGAGQFVAARCTFHLGARVAKRALRRTYEEWCQERGETPCGSKRFLEALRAGAAERGIDLRELSMRISGQFTDGWSGVRLMTDSERELCCGGVGESGGRFQVRQNVFPLKRDNSETPPTSPHTPTNEEGTDGDDYGDVEAGT